MKRLKVGAVNSISFIRNIQYTINSFDITFEKVVGGTALTLSNLQDQLELASCSDFIVLNIDLVTHNLEGGEYYMTVGNEGSESTYLCEVQSYQYNVLGNDIYSNSVVLSGDVTSSVAVENTDPVNPSSGSNSNSFNVTLRDDNYGDMQSPYYVRNGYFVQANIENISGSISKVRALITDSLDNQIQKDFVVTNYSLLSAQFIFENEAINFGDVATLEYQGLDSNDLVVYTSQQYQLIIPPKMEMYVAESLASAEDMRTNGKSAVEVLNGSTTTYNLYAYVESNYFAEIVLDNISSAKNKVFFNQTPERLFGTTPLVVNPTVGSMELIASDVVPSFSSNTSERITTYFSRFTWSGGYSTPLINNIPNVYNSFNYGVEANRIEQRPYTEETITIAGTTFTLEGFSPILYNSLTQYAIAPNDTLSLYMGDGSYQMNTNYINNIAVQQEYSDGSTEDFMITKSAISGGQAFGAMQGDPWDVVAYISKVNATKTLVHTKAWIKYGSYWFNIDNGSVDQPHFLLGR